MNRVLLLGATGFVGSSIGEELDRSGIEWIGVARASSSEKDHVLSIDDPEITNILRNKPIVINAMGGLKPSDFIRNFSHAMDEFWNTHNKLLELLHIETPQKIIHISSAGTVYGESPGRPSLETDFLRPRSWYGKMKAMEENSIRGYAAEFDIPFVCARISNPYGNSNASSHGLIDVFVNCVRKRATFSAAFSDGACRDFIYAPYMAEMLLRLTLSDQKGTFNIGSGVATSLQSIVELVSCLNPSVKIEKRSVKIGDITNSTISVNKFEGIFGKLDYPITVESYLRQALVL